MHHSPPHVPRFFAPPSPVQRVWFILISFGVAGDAHAICKCIDDTQACPTPTLRLSCANPIVTSFPACAENALQHGRWLPHLHHRLYGRFRRQHLRLVRHLHGAEERKERREHGHPDGIGSAGDGCPCRSAVRGVSCCAAHPLLQRRKPRLKSSGGSVEPPFPLHANCTSRSLNLHLISSGVTHCVGPVPSCRACIWPCAFEVSSYR